MSIKFGNWQGFLDEETNNLKNISLLSKTSDFTETVNLLRANGITRKSDWVRHYFKETGKKNLVRGKCNHIARNFRNKGNQFFKKKQYKEALGHYNNCILHAEQKSSELASGRELSLGYANRSAVYFHLEKYHECLSDVITAINTGYPEDLICKLHLRKAQCYTKLVNKRQAVESIENAKTTLKYVDIGKRDSTAKDISVIEKQIASLPDENKVRALERDVPTPTHGSNPVVLQASNSLELKQSSDQGRYLIAKEYIKAGDILIVEKPFAAVLLPPHYNSYCHHCFGKLTVCYPCSHCTEVWYCSETCKVESWRVYHYIECPYLDLLHSIGIAHLSLRVVLSAGLHQLLEFKQTLSQLPSGISGVTEQGTYERNYLSVYSLMPHSEDMAPEDLFQYSLTANLLLDLLENSDFFSSISQDVQTKETTLGLKNKDSESVLNHSSDLNMQSNNSDLHESNISMNNSRTSNEINLVNEEPNLSDKHCPNKSYAYEEAISNCCLEKHDESEEVADAVNKLSLSYNSLDEVKLYIGGLLLRHICQLVCNAHAITELQLSQTDDLSSVATQTQERIATAIYPTTSLLNHSCQPTIINSFIKDRLVVRAVRNIKPGEQVYNCYGPHAQRMSFRERQFSLKSQYFFACKCSACLTEGENESIYEALKCPKCCGPMVSRENTGQNKQTEIKEDAVLHSYCCFDCKFQTNEPIYAEKTLKSNEMFKKAIDLMETGSTKVCLDLLMQVVKIQDDIMYKYNRDRAQTHDAVAKSLVQLGKYKDAIPHLTQSIDTTRYIFGKTSIELAIELQKYAEVLLHARKKLQCIQAIEEAMQLFELHYGKDDDNIQELEKLLCVAKYSLT